MRNLKRALSLGLTAAMISGLMVMGSSAVSYNDSESIQNQTAVEILGEIGAMVGDDQGNFNPDQDVTRAEMAVIITRILYGNDLNVDQFKGQNIFSDVPSWAEGFVNLCANLDIVAGVGGDKFDPYATVTTAQAALMLSRALGYFQNNAEFGNDWALAAVRRATTAGIIGGDMVLQANEGLSRDDVAQMTFNTLTKTVPVQYNELLNVYYNENQGITYALTFNYLQTLGYTNFDLVYDNGDTTIYGRPATTWGIGTYRTTTTDKDSGSRYDASLDANGGLISSNVQILDKNEIITVPNTPDYVYTADTDEDVIYDDLGATLCNNDSRSDDYVWTIYVNGEEVFDGVNAGDVLNNITYEPTGGNFIPSNRVDETYQFTDDGAQTEIYVNEGDQTVTVVEINYYFGEVSDVREDEDGQYATIRSLSLLSDDSAKLDDRDFYTTEFAEDDYVVFTIDENDDDDFYICELIAPQTVDGTIDRVENNVDSSNTYLRLVGDDAKYYYSSSVGHMVYDLDDLNVRQHPSLEDDYTLYMDPNGYVLAYGGDRTVQYLYVQDSDEELRDWEARVIRQDALSDVVAIDEDITDMAGSDNIDWLNADEFDALKAELAVANDFSGTWPDSAELNKAFDEWTKVSNIDYKIWAYSENEDTGVYTLENTQTRYMTNVDINNGRAYIETEGDGNQVLIDLDTIFVDVVNEIAYVGYNEVPNAEHADIAYVEDDGLAEIVYIINGDIYDPDETYFVLETSKRESLRAYGDDYWEYFDAYVDGVKESVYVSYDVLEDLPGHPTNLTAGVLYRVVGTEPDSGDDPLYVTELEVVTAAAQSVNRTGNGSFWLTQTNGNVNKYDTDDETIYVVVESMYEKDGTFDRYDVYDGNLNDMFSGTDDDGYVTMVNVVKKDDNTAKLVYIWKFIPATYDVIVTVDGTVDADLSLYNVANGAYTIDYTVPADYTATYSINGGAAAPVPADGEIDVVVAGADVDVEIELTVAAINGMVGIVDESSDPQALGVAYQGEKPSLDKALAAVRAYIEAQGYEITKESQTTGVYTFEVAGEGGYYAPNFTFDSKTAVIEGYVATVDGDEQILSGAGLTINATPGSMLKITAPDGSVTYAASKTIDANGYVIEDGYDWTITVDGKPQYFKSTDTPQVKDLVVEDAAGTGYLKTDGTYAAYTSTTSLANGDSWTSGYVKVGGATEKGVPYGEEATLSVSVAAGTYRVTIGGEFYDNMTAAVSKITIPASDVTGDIELEQVFAYTLTQTVAGDDGLSVKWFVNGKETKETLVYVSAADEITAQVIVDTAFTSGTTGTESKLTTDTGATYDVKPSIGTDATGGKFNFVVDTQIAAGTVVDVVYGAPAATKTLTITFDEGTPA